MKKYKSLLVGMAIAASLLAVDLLARGGGGRGGGGGGGGGARGGGGGGGTRAVRDRDQAQP